MNRWIKRSSFTLFMILITLPNLLMAQFEQMLSVNISGGYFNTFGMHGYEPDWASGPDKLEPTLMPNFDAGDEGGDFIFIRKLE